MGILLTKMVEKKIMKLTTVTSSTGALWYNKIRALSTWSPCEAICKGASPFCEKKKYYYKPYFLKRAQFFTVDGIK